MAKGKKTGGRQKGTLNKKTLARRCDVREAVERIEAVLPDPFIGDGYALLAAIYKDNRLPLGVRMDAAKAAVVYERPRLAQVAMTTRSLDDLTDEEIFELRDAIRALQAQSSGKAIESHWEGEGT